RQFRDAGIDHGRNLSLKVMASPRDRRGRRQYTRPTGAGGSVRRRSTATTPLVRQAVGLTPWKRSAGGSGRPDGGSLAAMPHDWPRRRRRAPTAARRRGLGMGELGRQPGGVLFRN